MAALRTMVGMSKADTTGILDQSRVPTLVVMGMRDPDFPDAAQEAHRLAMRLHAECLLVEGAGHYPHAEFPEQVAPAVLAFLSDVSSRTTSIVDG